MIYVFLAQGFEETEAIATIDVLRRAELEIVTVGIGSKKITSTRGITVIADILDSEVITDNMDGVVLPGGMPGALNLEKSAIVEASVNYCYKNDLYIAAICAAPSILGKLGLLKDKKVTCFPGYEAFLQGAILCTESQVEVDGKIITGKGAGVTLEFALKIVEELKGEKLAQKIKQSLMIN